jgi:hypothetical protein
MEKRKIFTYPIAYRNKRTTILATKKAVVKLGGKSGEFEGLVRATHPQDPQIRRSTPHGGAQVFAERNLRIQKDGN